MEQFNILSVPTAIVMATFWWVAVYLFSRNPHSEKIRALSLAFFFIASYDLLGVLQTNLKADDLAYVNVQKILIWAIAFPIPAWFYFSTTVFSKEKRRKLKPWVVIGFVSGVIIALLGAFTHLLYDYSEISLTKSPSIYLVSHGELFWLLTAQVITFAFAAVYNFYSVARTKTGEARKAFNHLTIGAAIFAVSGTFLTLNVLFGNLYPETPGELLLLVGLIFVAYSVIRYSSQFETGVLLFGKEFVLSTLVLLGLYALFGGLIFLLQFEYSFKLLLLIVAGILLIPITHTGYDWFMSFARNIFYQKSLVIPKVTDGEVALSLRSYNKPTVLEESGLLRLRILDKFIERESLDRLAALKKLLREAIEYLRADDPTRRTRANLKYQMLRLIADQVEEGQILWDLGFEEYPLEIAERAEGRKPRFAITSPTDYQATSRNAFINLKKEAIHDLAWRISYLEKHQK